METFRSSTNTWSKLTVSFKGLFDGKYENRYELDMCLCSVLTWAWVRMQRSMAGSLPAKWKLKGKPEHDLTQITITVKMRQPAAQYFTNLQSLSWYHGYSD